MAFPPPTLAATLVLRAPTARAPALSPSQALIEAPQRQLSAPAPKTAKLEAPPRWPYPPQRTGTLPLEAPGPLTQRGGPSRGWAQVVVLGAPPVQAQIPSS